MTPDKMFRVFQMCEFLDIPEKLPPLCAINIKKVDQVNSQPFGNG